MTEIDIDRPLLEETDQAAREARERYTTDGVFVVNIMSSPGAGKTTLLERTLERLEGRVRAGVIECDIQGSADADRLERFVPPRGRICWCCLGRQYGVERRLLVWWFC